MYLCVCKAVSTQDVDEAVKSCGPSVELVRNSCGAGTSCGSCKIKLEEYVAEAAKAKAAPQRTGT